MKLLHGIALPAVVLALTPVMAAFLLLTVVASPFMMAYALWKGKV